MFKYLFWLEFRPRPKEKHFWKSNLPGFTLEFTGLGPAVCIVAIGLLTVGADDTPQTDDTDTDTLACCWLFGCHAIVLSLKKWQLIQLKRNVSIASYRNELSGLHARKMTCLILSSNKSKRSLLHWILRFFELLSQ